jgi:LysM repeat protein/ABC-type branched-subunit amino acid transport system substrate-binding protein
MIRLFRLVLTSVVLCGLVSVSFAQEKEPLRIVKTNDGEFILHKVEKGQTLYAISKLYSVSIEDIQTANPELESFGIRLDQTLRIPVAEIDKKTAKKASIILSGDTIYHEVLKKETLYALSNKYEVSVAELGQINPELAQGLKVGMIVKVPAVPQKGIEDEEVEYVQPEQDSLTLHEVKSKETLYSLAKLYNTSTDSIQMVNDGLIGGLKVGSTIRVPVLNPEFILTDTTMGLFADSNRLRLIDSNDTLKIAVFLPFCSEKNLANQEEFKNEELYGYTKKSIEFMRGFNLAMDSLKMIGYHISVNYFDTKNDTLACKRIANEENLDEYHLFVGPIYPANFEYLAKRAKELQTPIISPFKISSKVLLGNEYVIKSRSSSTSQVINTATYMGGHYKDSNLVIILDGRAKEKRYGTILQKHLSNAVNDSIPVNKIWQSSSSNFNRLIKKGTVNTVAIISSNEAFISSALSSFYKLIDEDTKIRVFGLDSWQFIHTIDLGYLQAMSVSYPVQQYINYSASSVDRFIENYRELYYTDPTKNVFAAFDIGFYFGNALISSQGNWKEFIVNNPQNGISIGYDLKKIGDGSGYENQRGFMMRNSDYELNLIH